MVVTEQISALRALGTDPIRKLVVPRMLAGIFMAPVLTVVSDFVGIFGGWVVARYQLQVSSALYWSSVTDALYVADLYQGLVKPFVFGFVIVTVACHVGLRTTGGTQGVAINDRVGRGGSVAVIAADFFVTRLLLCCMLVPAPQSSRSTRSTSRRREGRAAWRELRRAEGADQNHSGRADPASRRS